MSRSARRLRGPALLAALLATLPGTALSAQAEATVGVEYRRSPVAGATQALAGGEIWFGLGGPVRFGGGAWALPRPSRDGTLAGSGLELDFGYGGVGLEWAPEVVSGVSLRTVFGAGSATVVDRATAERVDSERFYLLEPRLTARRRLFGPASLSVGAGWRWTWGLDALTRVDPEDLDGWSISLGLEFGPF